MKTLGTYHTAIKIIFPMNVTNNYVVLRFFFWMWFCVSFFEIVLRFFFWRVYAEKTRCSNYRWLPGRTESYLAIFNEKCCDLLKKTTLNALHMSKNCNLVVKVCSGKVFAKQNGSTRPETTFTSCCCYNQPAWRFYYDLRRTATFNSCLQLCELCNITSIDCSSNLYTFLQKKRKQNTLEKKQVCVQQH